MSLNFRKDNRTSEKFAADLKRYAKEEAIIAEAIRLHLEEINNSKCSIIDIGIDSSGNIIDGLLKHHNVDREYVINQNTIKVEIKTAPHDEFLTFKVSSLKTAIKQNAYIVIVVKSQKKGFFLLTKAKMESIIKREPKIYSAFSPNDMAIRVYKNEFNLFLQYKQWFPKALEYIQSL